MVCCDRRKMACSGLGRPQRAPGQLLASFTLHKAGQKIVHHFNFDQNVCQDQPILKREGREGFSFPLSYFSSQGSIGRHLDANHQVNGRQWTGHPRVL